MELRLPKSIKRFFWSLFPFIMVLISIQNIFNNWELQHYGFSELEDFGRLLFVLGTSGCEGALIVVFLWLIIKFAKKVLDNQNN